MTDWSHYYGWWLVLICQSAFQVGGGHDEREEKVRRGKEVVVEEERGPRWKLKPSSVIKTGVNSFSPSRWPKELFTMATGEPRGGR